MYLGGGTPTSLFHNQLAKVIDSIRENFHIAPDAEFTVEANPNSLNDDLSQLFIERGVNRLSMGVQSFSDRVLSILGRMHNAAEASDAFDRARQTGFKNISIDLMYGIPGQTMEDWVTTLTTAVAMQPEHISAYSLSLDEGSQFLRDAHEGTMEMPDDDMAADMYSVAVRLLADEGYDRYEVSNFAIPGYECRHNMNYWSRGEYLGLGPAAWSYIGGHRYANISNALEYGKLILDGKSVAVIDEVVNVKQAAVETIMLGLRTTKGVELAQYEVEFGMLAVQQLMQRSESLQHDGLIDMSEGRLRFTDRGFLLSNEAITRLSE